MSVRAFRILRWLRRPHGFGVRWGLAVLAGIMVALLTWRIALAREAGGLFAADRFVIGAHRFNWYLRHGWTGPLLGRGLPLFDPTTEMPYRTVTALERWLSGRAGAGQALALLYVKARQITVAPDAARQQAVTAAFAAIAKPLVQDMDTPEPGAPALPVGQPPVFTMAQARTALTALMRIDTPCYVISGTFLGAVREGTFLAHDYDIDVGVDAEDFDDTAFRAQIAATDDLVLVNTSAHLDLRPDGQGLWAGPTLPALYRILHSSGIGIDVFVHHLDGVQRWHGSAKHRWNNHDFALDDYTIADLQVQGPAEADRYLTENYGDWRTPMRSFNCSTGTPNVQFPCNPTALAEHLRIALAPVPLREAQIARLILWREGYLYRQGASTAICVFPQAGTAGRNGDYAAGAENDNKAHM
jgi:hypothetical protein